MRDLNPRGLSHPTRFPIVRTRPLCESSAGEGTGRAWTRGNRAPPRAGQMAGTSANTVGRPTGPPGKENGLGDCVAQAVRSLVVVRLGVVRLARRRIPGQVDQWVRP